MHEEERDEEMGMEQYMGLKTLMEMPEERKSELPRVMIEETEFIVDIYKHEFRQVGQEHNRITLGPVKEEMGFHSFFYDTKTKNMYLGDTTDATRVPLHVKIVIVPPLKKLDPVGLAMRQRLPQDYYKGEQQRTLLCLQAIGRKRELIKRRKNRGVGK